MKVYYYPLINKIMTALKLRESLALTYEDTEDFAKPFITIAREPGSGGAPVAKEVAKRLGFTYVDEQIIDQIAQSTKKRRAVIKEIDEKNRSKIEDIVHSILNTEYVDDLTYITELTKVVLAYAYHGHVVILGRGANFICPFAMGLHVNVTAPYLVRVQRAMDFEGFDKKQARKVIAKVERDRREFVKQYFKQDPKGANAYDLTINTTYYSIKEAADIIIHSFYKKFPGAMRYSAALKP